MCSSDNPKILPLLKVTEILSSVVSNENIIDPIFKIASGTKKGDGFVSNMTNVTIKGKKKELVVIIKCAPNDSMRKCLPTRIMYLREIKYYTEIFPAFKKMQIDRNVSQIFDAAPTCYKTSSLDCAEFLIFEDLKLKNYRLCPKMKQMNNAHIELVLNSYANLHALSFALKEHDPELFQKLGENMDYLSTLKHLKETFYILEEGARKITDVFDKDEEANVYNYLKEAEANILPFFKGLENYDGNHGVLIHGDSWCNNMMFKYEDEEFSLPTDVRLIDFQMSSLMPPVIDLIYFFYVSASAEMMDNFKHYQKFYHDKLTKYMGDLSCDVEKHYPLSVFEEHWKKYAPIGLYFAASIYRMRFQGDDEILDFSETTPSNAIMKSSRYDDVINQKYREIALHFYKYKLLPPDPKSKVYEFLLSKDEKINLALIGALPNKGIEQVRIHWLINLIKYENGKYNFTYMDELMDWLHVHQLRPGFELMGTPLGMDKHYVKHNIYDYWQDLTYQISSRYIKRYNLNTVKKWRFETWNEPDLKMYNTYNFSLSEFLDYIRGCDAGLRKSALQFSNEYKLDEVKLKLGGPAGLFKYPIEKHPLCWGVLNFCKQECPLQFLSFHKKGEGLPENILKEDLQLLDDVYSKYPKLKNMPIANDEADILKTWSKSEEWRGDATYAAMITTVIIDHFKEIINERQIKIEVLSNDNGFMNYNPYYFTQRTLLTRFQMNNTKPHHLLFVQKPVYSTMGLLSFLGNIYIKTQPLSTLKILASKDNNNSRLAIILSCLNKNARDEEEIKLNLTIPKGKWKYAIYIIDNIRTNPYDVWKENGRPVFPNDEVFKKMISKQEPFRLKEPSPLKFSQPNIAQLRIKMNQPAVVLINICSKRNDPIGQPKRLSAITINHNKVLLLWKDNKINNKCLKTYEVEYSQKNASEGFKRINKNDTIFLSYYHLSNYTCKGYYRIRAVDYFNVKGPYSNILYYNYD